jgi:ribosomal protein S6--L-glutamate ligase
MAQSPKFIALGSRLRGVPEVLTLGVKPNFPDYSPQERELIIKTERILFPTLNYAQFFTTMGKNIFPSLETHLYSDEKIKQTTLFQLLGIPHPRTKIYYHLHHGEITKDFSFPFIAKVPRCSAGGRGVFQIRDPQGLEEYLKLTPIAYVQEYLPHERDLRVVLIDYEPLLAYWRIRDRDDFRTNLRQGGTIRFDPVPDEPLRLARETARRCRLNDVGLDLIQQGNIWYVIEANMNYGREGLRRKGLDLKEVMREKLLEGKLL